MATGRPIDERRTVGRPRIPASDPFTADREVSRVTGPDADGSADRDDPRVHDRDDPGSVDVGASGRAGPDGDAAALAACLDLDGTVYPTGSAFVKTMILLPWYVDLDAGSGADIGGDSTALRRSVGAVARYSRGEAAVRRVERVGRLLDALRRVTPSGSLRLATWLVDRAFAEDGRDGHVGVPTSVAGRSSWREATTGRDGAGPSTARRSAAESSTSGAGSTDPGERERRARAERGGVARNGGSGVAVDERSDRATDAAGDPGDVADDRRGTREDGTSYPVMRRAVLGEYGAFLAGRRARDVEAAVRRVVVGQLGVDDGWIRLVGRLRSAGAAVHLVTDAPAHVARPYARTVGVDPDAVHATRYRTDGEGRYTGAYDPVDKGVVAREVRAADGVDWLVAAGDSAVDLRMRDAADVFFAVNGEGDLAAELASSRPDVEPVALEAFLAAPGPLDGPPGPVVLAGEAVGAASRIERALGAAGVLGER